jgi:hypothetical protein
LAALRDFTEEPHGRAIIAGTKSEIGVGLSPTPGAAIFNDFARMPLKGGAHKLPGFLQVCGSRQPMDFQK